MASSTRHAPCDRRRLVCATSSARRLAYAARSDERDEAMVLNMGELEDLTIAPTSGERTPEQSA
jgi:hypothetical protein